jgi:hypothetical protein
VITVAPAKQFHGEVATRIAYSINQLVPRKPDSEGTADNTSILQRVHDFVETIGRYFAIGVDKPKDIALCNGGAGIHLRRASARRNQNAIAPCFR